MAQVKQKRVSENWIYKKHSLTCIIAVSVIVMFLFAGAGCAKEQPKTKSKGNKMSLLFEKPVYTLQVETFGVAHFIKVNGATVIFDFDDEGQTSVVFPVNHWMRSGENTISFDLYPPEPGKPFNPNSYVRVSLMVHELSNPEEEYTVATLHFSGTKEECKSHTTGSSPSGVYNSMKGFVQDKDGDILVFDATEASMPADEDYEGAMTFARKLNIPSSLPLWAFFNSDEMPDYRFMYHDDDEKYDKAMTPLFAEYRKIQNALEKRDIEAIMPMFEERNRETDMAFYRVPGTTANSMRRVLLESIADMKDGNLELLELEIRNVNYHLEDNKKIVSLRRRGLKPAIILNYKGKKSDLGSERYPIFFRYQNGKYILTR